MLMVVVLPAPFGPRKAKSSPSRTSKETSRTAVKSPNRRVRRSASIAFIPPPPHGMGRRARWASRGPCCGEGSAGPRVRCNRAIAWASSSPLLRAQRTQAAPQASCRPGLKPPQGPSPLGSHADHTRRRSEGSRSTLTHLARRGSGWRGRPWRADGLGAGQLREGVGPLGQHAQHAIGLGREELPGLPFHLRPDLTHHPMQGLQHHTGQLALAQGTPGRHRPAPAQIVALAKS
jgi:hypothetical protein